MGWHTVRMNDERIPKILMYGELQQGNRVVGRSADEARSAPVPSQLTTPSLKLNIQPEVVFW